MSFRDKEARYGIHDNETPPACRGWPCGRRFARCRGLCRAKLRCRRKDRHSGKHGSLADCRTTYALSYEGDGGTTLNSVRLDPESYDAYVKTGQFPVGAIFALEVRTPLTEVAPAKGGKTQGGIVGRSLHVKDEKGGPGTWTFYGYAAGSKVGTAIPRSQACYTCHQEHAGTTDTVFMQYYPTIKEAHARAAAAN